MFKYCQLQKNFFFHFHICDIQTVLIVFSSSTFVASKLYHWHLSSIWHLKLPIHFELSWPVLHQSIVGSVVECSPATRAARVRFPDDAVSPFVPFFYTHHPQEAWGTSGHVHSVQSDLCTCKGYTHTTIKESQSERNSEHDCSRPGSSVGRALGF